MGKAIDKEKIKHEECSEEIKEIDEKEEKQKQELSNDNSIKEEVCECEECVGETTTCDQEGCGCNCDHDELENALAKIKELEDQLLRSKADFINYRKRLEDEQSRILKYCNEDLIKEILPIVDDFERAISLDDDNLEDELSKFLAGFKMMYSNLLRVLDKFGVVAIDGKNKPFDPIYHQAVLQEKVDGVESGMVIEVLQKGYLLKGKVIRHAMVKVSE